MPYRKRWNLQEEMEPTGRDGTYFKRLKFRDFIEKRQICTFKKMGVIFLRKNAPAGILRVAPNFFTKKMLFIYIKCYLLQKMVFYKNEIWSKMGRREFK